MFRKAFLAIVLGAALTVATAAEKADPKAASYFDFAKITINERARADGTLRVRVTPENGAPREGTLAIHKRMSENDIAKGIATALEPVVGPEYEVERTAGEHVKLRKHDKKAPNFNVEVTFNVPGFMILIEN
jgi:hypothetical protein